MTDIAKAIAFATHCLGYKDACADGRVIRDTASDRCFDADSLAELQHFLQEFLINRYFIQINRGTSSQFRWRVIVGQQDLSVKGACWDHAIGVGEDLWDAVFDACVQAAGRITPN